MKKIFTSVICMMPILLCAQGNNDIFTAIDNKDIKAFTRAVTPSNINSNNPKGDTPLTYLLQKREDNKVIKKYLAVLFKNGADPNLPNKKRTPPLHLAGYDHEICSYLLKHGADINVKDSYGNTMLYDLLVYTEIYGGWGKYCEDIDYFVNNGGNINSLNNNGESVLISMLSRVMSYPSGGENKGDYLSHDFSPGIKYLVKKGINIKIITKSGESALSISRKTNASQEQIETIIKLGAEK